MGAFRGGIAWEQGICRRLMLDWQKAALLLQEEDAR